jgi:bifunctional UDP-N-acetylglucosamine pyrophosphorylase/glucosamine-1-phosphate N-acetyltransferase
MNIVILAAGQGKRMRSTLPKVLHPVAGRPMLAHVIATAQAVAQRRGVSANIIAVIGHGADQVRNAFSDRGEVRFVLQEPQLGTGHAVQQAVPLLDEPESTLVLYGDVPLVRVETLMRLIEGAAGEVGLLTVELADPTGYGRIVRDARGNVLRIVEQKDANDQERAIREVNTGILAAPTARLKPWLTSLANNNAQQEYYLTDVIAMAVHDGVRVSAVGAQDANETLGVNSKSQLAVVERIAQRRAAERLMEAGATLADPARIDVRGEVTVGADVAIDVGCIFEGRVQLADGVRIGPYCLLRDVTIGARTQLLAFSHLEGTAVGADARIGPYSRTRPGAALDDEVHIGNFVEVKASRMGRGAKANHLAYVGDADVGARTNIGAGTITANYDGVNKHKTEIGVDVQIGSNAVLVAPVKVGDGATVGAGSVVSREAPAGKLTVTRAKQVTVDGWKRPVKITKPA